MATSKLQKHMGRLLREHFPTFIVDENLRPEWLATDEGARVELDFFIEELNVAIEVQGSQHYVFSKHFHANPEGFAKQLQYDRHKKRVCAARGILLIEVAEEWDCELALEQIHGRMEYFANVLMGFDAVETPPDVRVYDSRLINLAEASRELFVMLRRDLLVEVGRAEKQLTQVEKTLKDRSLTTENALLVANQFRRRIVGIENRFAAQIGRITAALDTTTIRPKLEDNQ